MQKRYVFSSAVPEKKRVNFFYSLISSSWCYLVHLMCMSPRGLLVRRVCMSSCTIIFDNVFWIHTSVIFLSTPLILLYLCSRSVGSPVQCWGWYSSKCGTKTFIPCANLNTSYISIFHLRSVRSWGLQNKMVDFRYEICQCVSRETYTSLFQSFGLSFHWFEKKKKKKKRRERTKEKKAFLI